MRARGTNSGKDSISAGSWKYFLESDYYSTSDSLTLCIKSAYMLPADMQNVTLDLNKGTITDSNGIVPDMKIKSVVDMGETWDIDVECYNDYNMGPALGSFYWFTDGIKYVMNGSTSQHTEDNHYIEGLLNIKKPQNGIIKFLRAHPAYKADINVKIPIR